MVNTYLLLTVLHFSFFSFPVRKVSPDTEITYDIEKKCLISNQSICLQLCSRLILKTFGRFYLKLWVHFKGIQKAGVEEWDIIQENLFPLSSVLF